MKSNETAIAKVIYKISDASWWLTIVFFIFSSVNNAEKYDNWDSTAFIIYLIVCMVSCLFTAILLCYLLRGFAWIVYNSQYWKSKPDNEIEKSE